MHSGYLGREEEEHDARPAVARSWAVQMVYYFILTFGPNENWCSSSLTPVLTAALIERVCHVLFFHLSNSGSSAPARALCGSGEALLALRMDLHWFS